MSMIFQIAREVWAPISRGTISHSLIIQLSMAIWKWPKAPTFEDISGPVDDYYFNTNLVSFRVIVVWRTAFSKNVVVLVIIKGNLVTAILPLLSVRSICNTAIIVVTTYNSDSMIQIIVILSCSFSVKSTDWI